ncbi:MAG: DEAD/DEAH box helicase [Syntrophomonadaceae bacterium]|nr:DEAD/DEAH box helicase [Syntrophomonadaceae bacterium]
MNSLKKDREIASLLTRGWPAFFEIYGRLTSVQREVIPLIYEGYDVLVCSATASGKTEAACAPLIERFIDINAPWTILYISPTRALVNDLYERLYTPLSKLNLSLIRRTGDHATKLNRIPHVLITTPESFDSIICRGRIKGNMYGHVLARVQAVVLDEIHLLYGTSRGEQVRWLLKRLRRLKNQAAKSGWSSSNRMQIIGLSATVAQPEKVVQAFMPEGLVLAIPGKREIIVADKAIHPVEIALPRYIKSLEQPEKILVFSNTRKRVDNLTVKLRKSLKQHGSKVLAHHGSLSKRVREEVEEDIKKSAKIVACATSTLEIGIDIGDIDLIVLDGPAPDVPALLQRIGRGNRKTDLTRVLLCADNAQDAFIQKAMIEAAINGWMCAPDSGPNYSVALQQIASYIFQAPGRSRRRRLVEGFINSCTIPELADNIIEIMKQTDELIEDKAGVRLGEYWLNKTSSGDIHCNIDAIRGYNVIEETTGNKIATGVRYAHGKGLRTGGNLLQIKRFKDYKIVVRETKNESSAAGQWGYTGKKAFKNSSQAKAVRKYLGIEDTIWPVYKRADCIQVFHLGGTVRQTIIEAMAKMIGVRDNIVDINQFYFVLGPPIAKKPAWFDHLRPANFELFIMNEIGWFERKLCRPDANTRLPLKIRFREVKGWLNLNVEMSVIRESKWITVSNNDLYKELSIFYE